MNIAIHGAGFEPAKADKLRRAMATFRRTGTIGKLRAEFIQGMIDNGYPDEFAENCFRQIEGFVEYGFPESHAASFALLVYASCWFKAFYPDVFCAAILNAQPMGFYAPAQLIRDAREHGVEIRPIDVNRSDWDCTLEPSAFDPDAIAPRHGSMRQVIRTRHAVRLGLRQVKGLSAESSRHFMDRRGEGYTSVRDVWLRSGFDIGDMEALARADAFRSVGLDRRAALWAVKALDGRTAVEKLELFDRPGIGLADREPPTPLPAMPLGEHVIHDYGALGLSLKAHPVSFLRGRLERAGITPNGTLGQVRDGRRITVAGLILVRQRPGKGNAIFLTLEDESGIANVIIWARRFEQFRPIVMGARFVRVSGKLQSESGVVHIVADAMEDLTPWLAELSEKAARIDTLARADEVKRPGDDHRIRAARRHAALIADEIPDVGEIARETSAVMPKGRNFH